MAAPISAQEPTEAQGSSNDHAALAETLLRRRSEQLQGLAEAALAVARAPTLKAILDDITRESVLPWPQHCSASGLTTRIG